MLLNNILANYYYILSDILISDISSSMFEYLALNRPIIQAKCYSLKLRHRIFYNRFMKKMDLERQESVDFAYQISDPADLISRVYFALDNVICATSKTRNFSVGHLTGKVGQNIKIIFYIK